MCDVWRVNSKKNNFRHFKIKILKLKILKLSFSKKLFENTFFLNSLSTHHTFFIVKL